MLDIHFINQHSSIAFSEDNYFQAKVSNVFVGESFRKDLFLNIVFLSDEDLLEINKEYLNHDFYTDIITFPIEETEEYLEADIYISLDRVKDNAKEFNVAYELELLRVVIHGALHLCGYKDKTEVEIKTMRGKEDYYISL